MKQTTAKAIVETIRNLKGILTIWEAWARREGGLVIPATLGSPPAKDAFPPAPEADSKRGSVPIDNL